MEVVTLYSQAAVRCMGTGQSSRSQPAVLGRTLGHSFRQAGVFVSPVGAQQGTCWATWSCQACYEHREGFHDHGVLASAFTGGGRQCPVVLICISCTDAGQLSTGYLLSVSLGGLPDHIFCSLSNSSAVFSNCWCSRALSILAHST